MATKTAPKITQMSFSMIPGWGPMVDPISGTYWLPLRKRFFRITKTDSGIDVYEVTEAREDVAFLGSTVGDADTAIEAARYVIQKSFL